METIAASVFADLEDDVLVILEDHILVVYCETEEWCE